MLLDDVDFCDMFKSSLLAWKFKLEVGYRLTMSLRGVLMTFAMAFKSI